MNGKLNCTVRYPKKPSNCLEFPVLLAPNSGRSTVMMLRLLTLWVIALFLLPPAYGQLPGAPQNVQATIESETTSPAPGDTVTVAIIMDPKPGWHDYWLNPGDAGTPLELEWTLPEGVSAGPIRAPVPETLVVGGFMNHIYRQKHAFLVDIKLPPKLQPSKQIDLKVDARWSACSDLVCVPEGGSFVIPLKIGDGRIDADQRSRFDMWRAALPVPLDRQAQYKINGKVISVAIPFPENADAQSIWFFPQTENVFRYAAKQSARRSGDWLVVSGEIDTQFTGRIDGVLRFGDAQGLIVRATPGMVPQGGNALSVLGEKTGEAGGSTPGNLFWILGLSILGGLLLNLMPCVFPILGLKAIAIAKSGGNEREARLDAVAYTTGIILSCLALGGAMLTLRAAGEEIGWAFQLQDPNVIFLLLLLMTAITANLVGLFDIGTIGAGDSLTRKKGMAGSFWTGVLAAVVATPCTGPFMAAAMGAALLLPVGQALLIFAGLGFGLALPFLAIAFIPPLRAHMPKAGPWMENFRRWMAVPMALTAAALLWLLAQLVGSAGWVIGGVSVAVLIAALFITTRKKAHNFAILGLASLIAITGIFAITRLEPPKTGSLTASKSGNVPFSVEKLAAFRADHRPVFLYFTADWCVTCKVNEAAAIDREETKAAFKKAAIVTMVGDYTRRDPAITRFLAQNGRSGVPLYLYYPAKGEPQILPQILTEDMMLELAK
jgi:DsbC/DsbD-like thiol-disulfide interchange protein/cytochrome c biogenesis protein CcdA